MSCIIQWTGPHLTCFVSVAKAHFIDLVLEGMVIPIDDGPPSDFKRPAWFDRVKYDRGRHFYEENQFGIVQANLAGLVILLAIPEGLRLLHATGRSSDGASARKRYQSTVSHLMAWYKVQLTDDSV